MTDLTLALDPECMNEAGSARYPTQQSRFHVKQLIIEFEISQRSLLLSTSSTSPRRPRSDHNIDKKRGKYEALRNLNSLRIHICYWYGMEW
jgi:hypothetical protein